MLIFVRFVCLKLCVLCKKSDIFEVTACNDVCEWVANVCSGQTTLVWPKTKSLNIFE